MEQTANYQLSQWAGEDRILREDFNANNAKIEQVLTGMAEAQDKLLSTIANWGNCKIEYSTYTGTGTYGSSNKNSLTFEEVPLLVIVVGYNGQTLFMNDNIYTASISGSNVNFTWSGSTVSWYSNASSTIQFNDRTTYRVFTLYAK